MAKVVWTSPNKLWKVMESAKGMLSVVCGKKGTVANGKYPVVVDGTEITINAGEDANFVPNYVAQALRKFIQQYKCIGCKKTPWELTEYKYKRLSPRKYLEEHEGTLHMFKQDCFYCTDCYIKAGQPTGTPRRYARDEIQSALREVASTRSSRRQGYPYDQEEVLPAFVYGTLRNGCGNYEWLLKGHTKAEMPAKLEGAAMYNLGGCPMILKGEGTIVGELMYINDEEYPEVLRGLDDLECFNPSGNPNYNNYNRERVTVKLEDDSAVEAWVYWGNRGGEIHYPVIPTGNWLDASRYRQSYSQRSDGWNGYWYE